MSDEVFFGADEDAISEDEMFETILDRLLDYVPDTIDKREGSVIYNALAPVAVELMQLYLELQAFEYEAYADTANLDYLTRRAAERGIIHKEATHAIVKGEFEPANLDVTGGRFTELATGLSYIALDQIEPGIYRLECEEAGEIGNVSSGQLITDESFDDETELESARITGIISAASEEEELEAFRQRYFNSIDSQAFGGNVADYKAKMLEQEKVGGVKVYPIWNGGGTVKLVFLNNAFSSPDASVVNEIQTLIDPEVNQGKGKGIAPIGHVVSVFGAESVTVNITAEVVYTEGNSRETSIEAMTAAVGEYFLDVRKVWGNDDCETGSIVRISHIENKLLNLPQILDVQVTALNGNNSNIQLEPHQVPITGGITDGVS